MADTYQCKSSIDISSFIKENTQNCLVKSDVHQCMKELDCWVGIDEAGRGPVLGMRYSFVKLFHMNVVLSWVVGSNRPEV